VGSGVAFSDILSTKSGSIPMPILVGGACLDNIPRQPLPPDALPWICPEHPHAAVLHVWDEEHFVIGGLPAGSGIKKNERYVCPVCMRELAPPERGPRPL